MDRSRTDQILAEWAAVADHARPPVVAPRPVGFRSAFSPASLLAAAALGLVLVFGAAWLGSRGPNGNVGAPGVTPTPSSVTTPTPVATATPRPTIPTCTRDDVAAMITMWEGAAGHRIAHLDLTKGGTEPCVFDMAMRPQLVDGNGTVLINGTKAVSSGPLVLAPLERLTTLVDTDNYCGADPRAPVTIEFRLEDGSALVAAPQSPNDATVPPCNSAPGTSGQIQMHPWERP
jgi:hypothetical protein